MFLSILEKLIWPQIVLLLFFNAAFASPIAKQMTVKTVLDKNQFFDGEISLYFKDKLVYTEIDKNTNNLRSIKTKVYVESKFLSLESDNSLIHHSISLTKNESRCYRTNEIGQRELIVDSGLDSSYKNEMANIYLSGNELKLGESIKFEHKNNENDISYIDDYDFRIDFSAMPLEALFCEGDVQLTVGFDL
ncbi:hypothetical protein K08M3_18870 [Vibrio alginolyticus]|uniref:Uncharacterized protein n=1 Tax=Vibrio alginolyticus TaxID=663 RepID=A0A1W6TSC6_VIBAL|nr:hypothetical protein [Vibrio alginolyticus]ARO98824.1 hypothetical protein K01M1_18830 [Vibrio alginolyticus]ARP03540.1 hypothetical protein K04M1_18960 [Vibrio alginolyticus]ARP08600.1 hypothetical protein K04M3_18990 [Vibrio alginolyticus]ARP13675.1 hypothetical protein K04M5_18870 [Vibrio alginolyticus]ARP18735.1 hypothetical protein K05K4_19010 [Vibrio alginolyticus]